MSKTAKAAAVFEAIHLWMRGTFGWLGMWVAYGLLAWLALYLLHRFCRASTTMRRSTTISPNGGSDGGAGGGSRRL